MELSGPCELVFNNPETKHFAVLDRRLTFSYAWQAGLFIIQNPAAPPRLQWLKLYPNADQFHENCITLEELLDESRDVDKFGKNWELLVKQTATGFLCTQFHQPDLYGTKTIAEEYREWAPALPKGFEWQIMKYDSNRAELPTLRDLINNTN